MSPDHNHEEAPVAETHVAEASAQPSHAEKIAAQRAADTAAEPQRG